MQRRDFIKLLGLASGAAVMESCGAKKDAEKLIPYVIPPEVEIFPGGAVYFSTACMECPAHCGVSAKVVEKQINNQLGRYPIKLEGIAGHPINDGKLCMRGQSSLTRLYQPNRLRNPMMRDENGNLNPCTWDQAFSRIVESLKNSSRRHVYLSSRTSGSLANLIDTFCQKLNVERLPEFEIFSYANLREANNILFTRKEIPSLRIENSDFLLTIGADIFETFISPVSHAVQFARAKQNGNFKWFHVEPHVSLTGLQASERLVLNPESEIYLLLFILKNARSTNSIPSEILNILPDLSNEEIVAKTGLGEEALNRIISKLNSATSPLLIVGGIATGSKLGLETAVLAGLIQWKTGMIDSSVDFSSSVDYSRVGSFKDLSNFSALIQNNKIGVAFISKTDPIEKHPFGFYLRESLQLAELVVGIDDFMPSLKEKYNVLLPLSHSLESWGDAQPKSDILNVIQPVLNPLHDTLSEGDLLIQLIKAYSGEAIAPNFQDYIFAQWKKNFSDYQIEQMLTTGYIELPPAKQAVALNINSTNAFIQNMKLPESLPSAVLLATPSIKSFDGRSRNLPLIKEIPDPLTTITHDQWMAISEKIAEEKLIKDSDMIFVFSGDKKIVELPAKIQPVLSEKMVMIQRDMLETFALAIDERTGESLCYLENIRVEKTGEKFKLAILSGSLSQQGRGVIPNPNHKEHHHERHSLYPEHEHPDYRWAMAIDLNLCIGCGACVAACYIENNVAIVGRERHVRGGEMSWIRIEPYYENGEGVHFLPMLCQHCDYAPCESVCPVYAPYHTPEGLNAQIYNRCVGTRYCSNNCPYKVRRFNWLTPPRPEPMDKMVNPEMWARPKGVMEKCTFCVQRIRFAKDKAKDENRKVRDGEIVPACAQTCPTNAIVFGNIKDENSRVYQLAHSERAFRVFEQLGTEPAVYYLHRKKKILIANDN
ncbi:MAG: 4Fe-4S dicluster domain-containing protein [bacterium]|nr:4Fe-4S dicluster domain-containing protein [bacterium]